jgi:hypothetical protein
MPFTSELVHELNTLVRFNLETSQQGIKVHTTAAPEIIAANDRRLACQGFADPGRWRLPDRQVFWAATPQSMRKPC